MQSSSIRALARLCTLVVLTAVSCGVARAVSFGATGPERQPVADAAGWARTAKPESSPDPHLDGEARSLDASSFVIDGGSLSPPDAGYGAVRAPGVALGLERGTAAVSGVAFVGLENALRPFVNVEGRPLHRAASADTDGRPVGDRRAADGAVFDPLKPLLVALVDDALEPYRRADGTVALSVFGFGDISVTIDHARRLFRVVEAETGLSLTYVAEAERPVEPVVARDEAGDLMPAGAVSTAAPVAVDARLHERVETWVARLRSLGDLLWTPWPYLLVAMLLIMAELGSTARERRLDAPSMRHEPVGTRTTLEPTPGSSGGRSRSSGRRRSSRRDRGAFKGLLRGVLASLGLSGEVTRPGESTRRRRRHRSHSG
ncbi:MAG: hypothetical protein H6983_10040 [Ectothiorhodospiraceae bacterium]|nr:hypothetical protein [Chromatiales bacterium]MCP5154495.1 hypothetical protein [Ectothiorhodospiraceae bacterium]